MYNNIYGLHRAKSVETGEWVEGYLLASDIACYIVTEYDALDIVVSNSGYSAIRLIQVYSETVCPYSGENDSNGTRVFVGDILIPSDERLDTANSPIPVVFEQGTFFAGWADNHIEPYDFDKSEIVGNVFDDPEMVVRRIR